jgi:hypothetical protein
VGIERVLERAVHSRGAGRAAVHGQEDLHAVDRVHGEPAGMRSRTSSTMVETARPGLGRSSYESLSIETDALRITIRSSGAVAVDSLKARSLDVEVSSSGN